MALTRSNIAFLLSMVLSLGYTAVADVVADSVPEPLRSRVDLSDEHTDITILSVQSDAGCCDDPLIRTPETSISWIEYGAYTTNDISIFFKDKSVPSGLAFGFVPPVNSVLMPSLYQGVGNTDTNQQMDPKLIIISDAPIGLDITDSVRWNFEILEIEFMPNGELFRFAANFSLFSDSTECCQSITTLGEVRFNSKIPLMATLMTMSTPIPTLSIGSLCTLSFLMMLIGYHTLRLKAKLRF